MPPRGQARADAPSLPSGGTGAGAASRGHSISAVPGTDVKCSSGGGEVFFRSDSTSAATWRRSWGVSSSMLAIRSSRSRSPGSSRPAGASS